MSISDRFFPLLILPFLLTGCMGSFYYPDSRIYQQPENYGYRAERFRIGEEKESLSAWLIGAENKGDLVIHFHGNAANITNHFPLSSWLSEHGYRVLLFDYRGYGDSSPLKKISPQTTREDAIRVLCFAEKRADASVILFGQSLGGIIALDALMRKQCTGKIRAVVLEGTFSSYQALGRKILASHWQTWMLQPLAWLLLSDSHAPENGLPALHTPALVLHATGDPVVPFSAGERLYSRLPKKSAQFLPLAATGHLNYDETTDERKKQTILKFLENSEHIPPGDVKK